MFGENGDAIRCARALGPYLVAKGASAYDTAAYAANMGGGPDELRPDVVSSLKGQAVAIIALGRELSWLAEVLPSLANGDSVPYWSTATAARQQYREIGNPALDLLIDQGDDCGGCTLIGTLAVAEEQAKLTPQEVYVLAMMMRSAP
jgi:hypothetical protein